MDNQITAILADITSVSSDVYFIYNIDQKRIIHLSPSFEIITHLEVELILRHPRLLLKVIHKDDHRYLKQKVKNILNDDFPVLISFRIIREDGELRWIKLTLHLITAEDNTQYMTGIAGDDTIRRTSLLTMEKVTAWKSSSLEILSHDLKEPISIMKMLASIIEKKIPENKDIQKFTSLIQNLADKNANLIQSLFKRELVAAEEVGIKKERLDMVWEIKQALLIYLETQQTLRKNISFTHSHEQIYADVDSLKILQVVNNLLSNAIKFTGNNGNILVHLEQFASTFLLSVNDDGIGIPKKIQPYIFEKYSKAGRIGVDGQESTGLGMWIVRSLVDEHEGRVWFDSKEKFGSTFYVEIPIGEFI